MDSSQAAVKQPDLARERPRAPSQTRRFSFRFNADLVASIAALGGADIGDVPQEGNCDPSENKCCLTARTTRRPVRMPIIRKMSPILLVALALNQGPDPAHAAIKRFADYWAAHPKFSVDIDAEIVGFPGHGAAKLSVSMPTSMRFDVKWGNLDYTLAMNPSDAIEIERHSQEYNEIVPEPKLFIPASVFAGFLPSVVPINVMDHNLLGEWPKSVKIEHIGVESIGGVNTEHLRLTALDSRDLGSIADASVDSVGRLARYEMVRKTPNGVLHTTLLFTNYLVEPVFDSATFHLDAPIGYVPFAIPGNVDPIAAKESLPRVALTAVSSGKRVDLKSILAGKKTLLAVTNPDSAPSMALMGTMSPILAEVKAASGRVVVISESTDRAVAKKSGAAYYDSDGKSLAAFKIPGTPILYLVDAKGTLIQAWYGFDPTQKANFLADLKKALAG